MAYVKPKYEGEDFLEWYKTHYGKDYDGSTLNRGEGMLDQDWEIGNALYGTYKDKQAREEGYIADTNTLTNNYNNEQALADKQYESALNEKADDYQKAQNKLLENYNSSVSGLEKSKNQSLQSASITYDKLKKYLPTQIKAQGLGGLGVSESTMLQAHNNYATQTGAIKNNYNENKMALDKGYAEGEIDLETAYGKDKTTLLNEKAKYDTERKNKYNEDMRLLEKEYGDDMRGYKTDVASIMQNYKTQEETRMSNVAKGIEDSLAYFEGTDASSWNERINNAFDSGDITGEDKERLLGLVEVVTGGNLNNAVDNALVRVDTFELESNWEAALSELEASKTLFEKSGRMTEYNNEHSRLKGYYDKQQEEKATEEAKKKQEETDKRILEGKEYISYGGSQYKVKTQLNENSNEIGHNRNFTEQIKEKFGTTNPYDSKIPNGTVLTIKCDSKGKNEVNYEDFGLADVTDWRNWIPGYNIYNQITKWGNFETRHVAYYNGNWYLVDKK